MSVTPTGEVGKYVDGIMDHVSNSSTFRTWFGAASVALAKAMITLGQTTPSTGNQQICIFPELTNLRCDAIGMGAPYANKFSCVIEIFAKFTTEAFYSMDNNMAAVINEMIARSATGVGPRINNVEYFPPIQASVIEDNDYWYSAMTITSEL